MKFRHFLPLALFTSLAPSAAAQAIKYEKYALDNGMTVILHEDHSLPVATINTWYRVGSKDERPGRSGFAHLFEHLMFMGTERVPDGEFDTLMEAAGGANNASTSSDRTNYFSWGPSSLLPTLLWLDADRLEDLGRAMTQEKLDAQRDVVRNERRQSSENRPYGKADLMLNGLMYPEGHPYHWPVIGSHEDLEAASLQDVKDFFAQYYVPSNASLVVAGDFDPNEIKPLIASLFGDLPAGAAPPLREVPPARLDRVVRVTSLDQVQLPLLSFVYHSPAFYREGDAEMDLLAKLLSDGKSSRLYKRLVLEDQTAVDVSAYQASEQLGSTFQIHVYAAPGSDLAAIEAAVDEELARISKEGPSAEELERRKTSIEVQMLSGLESLRSRADQLNQYEYYFGEPDSFRRDLERYRSATPEGVRDWARRVLTADARLIGRVLPEEPERAPSARDARPASSASKGFEAPAPERFRLSNGIEVEFWRQPSLPLISLQLALQPGGPIVDPAQAGLADLTCDMLDEGTAGLDALAFGDRLEELGASFDASAGRESIEASLSCMARHFGPALELCADALKEPTLSPEDWERIKRLHLENLKQRDDNPGAVARNVGMRLFFGEGHPFALPVSGTRASVEALSLEEVRAYHASHFGPAHARLFVAGDIELAQLRAQLERTLGSWEAGQGRVEVAPVPPPMQAPLRVAIVDRPGAVQTVVRFMLPAPTFDDPRRVPLEMIGTILGGSFTSRLNQNLREDKGYTYGAGASFALGPRSGWFSASSNVRTDVTGASLAEFLKEFSALRSGDISEEEVQKARLTLRTATISSMEGLDGVLAQASELALNGREFAEIGATLSAMERVDAAGLNRLAKDAIALEGGVLVLVGDQAAILAQLEGLGLPQPLLLDVHGER